MGIKIGLIVLTIAFILVNFCNYMVNFYQTKFQEKLDRRVTELEWQNKKIEEKLTKLEKGDM